MGSVSIWDLARDDGALRAIGVEEQLVVGLSGNLSKRSESEKLNITLAYLPVRPHPDPEHPLFDDSLFH